MARVVLKTIAFILLFVLLIFLLLLTPPAQRLLTARVQHFLGAKLHTKVAIGRISFGLSGKIALRDVYIADQSKDTLISGGSIRAHLNFLKLFSNEVWIKDLELQDVTARIKRVLPDTVYNYQFIINAFTSGKTSSATNPSSTPMKLDINDVMLRDVNLVYTDAVAGDEMVAHIGEFAARIDTLDPYAQQFVIPRIVLRNSSVTMRQVKPLAEPEPLPQPITAATNPSPMTVQLGTIDLEKIKVDYGNDVSAFYTTATIGKFLAKEKMLDLDANKINLDELELTNSKITTRVGRTLPSRVVKQEVGKGAKAQRQAEWNVEIKQLKLNGNSIQFDDDNKPPQSKGIDYSHLSADGLSMAADNFFMSPDSMTVSIKNGALTERSGLKIEQLKGDILYASNHSFLRNFYIKTPGSVIRRSIVLDYPSLNALTNHLERVAIKVDLERTKIQVKDLLVFAPQLRSRAAFKDPNAIWKVNLAASGTVDQFSFESLQFAGLSNTQINAHGSLTGLMNPKKAGGNFLIERFHTNQHDLALFTGTNLSNGQMDLPGDFTISGQIKGNAGSLNTQLNVLTPDGAVVLKGEFANLENSAATTYRGTLTTKDLQLGKILRQQNSVGRLSAFISVNGKGLTANDINSKFAARISKAEYNRYTYTNVNLSGSVHKTGFEGTASIKDPNADASLVVSGEFSDHPAFSIHGKIDSVKAQTLHLTAEPLIVRGNIIGKASDISAANITAKLLITQALFVSGANRLSLDTIELRSGRNDTANYIVLKSSVASAGITGEYRIADLGNIIQNTIQPYFSTTVTPQQSTGRAYHFRFYADVTYHPILSAFLPGLTAMQSLHSNGEFASPNVMNAILKIPSVTYQGSDISGLNISANTSTGGLQIKAGVSHLKSGNSFDIYNARVDAVASKNTIDFSLGLDDANSNSKYSLAGLISQPTAGTYTIRIKPDGLLLNYQKWTVSPGNLITLSPDNISANNFVLQNGNQRLALNSPPDRGQQVLVIDLSNFRLATITGFVKADSVLADGLMNGTIRLSNFMKQPNFTGDLTIHDLSVRNDTIGNLTGHVASSGLNRYQTEVDISGRGNDVALKGWFGTAGSETDLNLDLNVRAIQLHTMEGAMAGAISNASGAVQGNVSVRGTMSHPSLQGKLNFDKSSFVLPMLGSQFHLDNQTLSVTNDGFAFNNFTIKDSSGNAVSLNGNISTSNFVNYEFNLKVTARNFQLLNSTKKENPVYYGRMNISSDLVITGSETKPSVDGRMTVNNGTTLTFVVPQTEQGIQEREGIIEFVDMRNRGNDTLFRKYDSLNKASVLGMDISLNIEVKREAVFNIIVDAANGDFLNAQGEAELTAGIDPSGKVTLTGNYTLEKGAYQLSFNFLKRRFDITKGSTITWTGEPTTAKLDISATYVARTSPIDLVQDQVEGSSAAIRNTYLQKLPFELHLNLTGELIKPAVAFDIVLPENKNYGVSNDVVATVEYKLAQLREDQGETNKQVFSLLLLNRFVGQNPFQSAGGAGEFNVSTYARQSASKLLTEQLNQLAANLINGVDVNFDVASTDDYTTGSLRNRTDLSLNVSKRLLNDRLKISVGSNFELEGPQNTNQQSNNIAGNVAIDYQLSRDGKYFVRYFRKNDYEGEVDGYVIENGLSFIISVDYNRFIEILRHRKQKVTGVDNRQKDSAK